MCGNPDISFTSVHLICSLHFEQKLQAGLEVHDFSPVGEYISFPRCCCDIVFGRKVFPPRYTSFGEELPVYVAS